MNERTRNKSQGGAARRARNSESESQFQLEESATTRLFFQLRLANHWCLRLCVTDAIFIKFLKNWPAQIGGSLSIGSLHYFKGVRCTNRILHIGISS